MTTQPMNPPQTDPLSSAAPTPMKWSHFLALNFALMLLVVAIGSLLGTFHPRGPSPVERTTEVKLPPGLKLMVARRDKMESSEVEIGTGKVDTIKGDHHFRVIYSLRARFADEPVESYRMDQEKECEFNAMRGDGKIDHGAVTFDDPATRVLLVETAGQPTP